MYGTSDNKCAQLNPGSCFFTELIVIESFTQSNHAVDAQHKEVGIMLTNIVQLFLRLNEQENDRIKRK
jgi:hypothetical protein